MNNLIKTIILGALAPIVAASFSAAYGERVNGTAFGATGDGETNDAPAIQRALESAAAGTEVFLPAGRYRLDEGLRVPSGVTLAGTWQAPHHAQHRKGTILLGYADSGNETGPALIHLMPNSAVRGITIYYPEQRLPEAVPYPWTIQGEGMHGSVIDVTLVNSYKGIDFGQFSNELHYIRNVFGTPLKAGVHIDQCTDIGRIENVHFNPHYWARSGEEYVPEWQDLLAYLFENCVAFDIGRSDWEFISNTFSYGCKIGYRFYESESGPANGNFLGIAADWAQTCILVEQTQPPGLLITNGEFVGGRGSKAVIDIAGSHSGVVQFSNSSFWGPHEVIIRNDGPGFVSIQQCNFQHWDIDDVGLPAILMRAGEANISNNFFRENRPQIVLEERVDSAVIMGNRFLGAERIVNLSRGDVQIGLNAVAHRQLAFLSDPLPDPWQNWRFRPDPDDKGVEQGWHRPEVDDDDEDWLPITVPGPWHAALEDPYYGYGWYRATFTLPEEATKNGVKLHFEAVDEQAWVYVNGRLVGEHTVKSEKRPVEQLWDRPFVVALSPEQLDPSGENLLAVRVHASAGGAGIWRRVRIYP